MTSSNLKIIAIVTMLIDHTGAILFPQFLILRIIGRLAFPIFAFLIVEGYHHTKDLKKYIIRLSLFALVSEVPFDLAFYRTPLEFSHQNVFFTLALGLILISLYHGFGQDKPLLALGSMILIGSLSIFMKTDYSIFGLLMIFTFDQMRGRKVLVLAMASVVNLLMGSIIQAFAILSMPIIYFYNGKKGISLKYIFYGFYPVHLLILYGLSL